MRKLFEITRAAMSSFENAFGLLGVLAIFSIDLSAASLRLRHKFASNGCCERANKSNSRPSAAHCHGDSSTSSFVGVPMWR